MQYPASRYLTGSILLLLGGGIYVFFRPSDLFNGLPVISTLILSFGENCPEWILYTLPDALWFSALLCFQTPLKIENKKAKPLLTVLACLIAPVHEVSQLCSEIPGTYCAYDMSAYCVIIILYLIICLKNKKNQLQDL